MRAALLLFALGVGTVVVAPAAAQAPDGKAANDAALKALAGKWTVESRTLSGRAFPQVNPPPGYEFDGPVAKLLNVDGYYLIGVDATANPKRLTFTEAESKNGKVVPKDGGQVRKSVYELKGDTLVFTMIWKDGADFPDAVQPPGYGKMVVTMTREKAK